MQTRRSMIRASLGAAGTLAATGTAARIEPEGRRFALFTKHLLGLSPERLADTLAALGVEEIEAPIRPGGHVEPARVADDLPRFAEVLKQRGVAITTLASGINAVSREQHTETVLRTARALQIPRFRMNWYTYDLKQPIWPQLDAVRPRLKELVALSKEIGILPCYQNHSGKTYVGAPVWDMALLMRDYPREELAWCFDVMHATIEGGLSWPIETSLALDHIAVVNFKNFAWQGKQQKDVPLREGVVGKDTVDLLKSLGYRGPITLHVEYLEHEPRNEGYYPRAFEATSRDLETLRSWWE
ncbi:MAG: TIM barrel protein [Isosphaeraceae bacterium]